MMNLTVILPLCIIGLFALGLLWAEGLLKRPARLFTALVFLLLAFLLRGLCMDHETLDYINFLSKWVDYFRLGGGFSALAGEVGNYNLPYLYFLAAFSYLDIPDLYLIKLLSIFFDVILAWGLMRLVGVFTHSSAKKLAAFLITLLMPTVILNGAYWGQCDCIYIAFAVLSIALALEDRPVASMICISLSFAFKLQAVFIMPVFFVLLFTKRIRIRHLPVFVLTYLAVILPALLAGRPFAETLTLYLDQAGTVGSGLNYNSPSMFAFIKSSELDSVWASLGIAGAFLFIFTIYAWLLVKRNRVTDEVILLVTVLFSIGIPFLLPHMHDRYFFGADVFALALAVVWPRLTPVPVLVSFASLLGYHAYLRQRYFLPMSYGAAALLVAILLLLYELFLDMHVRQRYKT